jgi:hypothetical protein
MKGRQGCHDIEPGDCNSFWPTRALAAGARHHLTNSGASSQRFPRASQNVEASTMLVDKLPEVETPSDRRTHQDIRGLLKLTIWQQTEFSASQHHESGVDRCTASTPVRSDASMGQPPRSKQGMEQTLPCRLLGRRASSMLNLENGKEVRRGGIQYISPHPAPWRPLQPL